MAARLIDIENIVYADTRADIPAEPPGTLTLYFIEDESAVVLVSKSMSVTFGDGGSVPDLVAVIDGGEVKI
jgi:hypothetical protein